MLNILCPSFGTIYSTDSGVEYFQEFAKKQSFTNYPSDGEGRERDGLCSSNNSLIKHQQKCRRNSTPFQLGWGGGGRQPWKNIFYWRATHCRTGPCRSIASLLIDLHSSKLYHCRYFLCNERAVWSASTTVVPLARGRCRPTLKTGWFKRMTIDDVY